jgi:membrane protein required for colicin V production
MLLVDYLILGVVVLSMLIGAFRGFFPEVLSLLGWIVGLWIAWQYADALQPALVEHVESPVLALWIARFVLFAAVVLVAGLLTEVVSLAIERTGLSGANRALGLAFGLARGLVVVGALTLFAHLIELSRAPWWDQAKLVPYAERIAAGLEAFLPEVLVERLPASGAAAPEGTV